MSHTLNFDFFLEKIPCQNIDLGYYVACVERLWHSPVKAGHSIKD